MALIKPVYPEKDEARNKHIEEMAKLKDPKQKFFYEQQLYLYDLIMGYKIKKK